MDTEPHDSGSDGGSSGGSDGGSGSSSMSCGSGSSSAPGSSGGYAAQLESGSASPFSGKAVSGSNRSGGGGSGGSGGGASPNQYQTWQREYLEGERSVLLQTIRDLRSRLGEDVDGKAPPSPGFRRVAPPHVAGGDAPPRPSQLPPPARPGQLPPGSAVDGWSSSDQATNATATLSGQGSFKGSASD